MNTVTVNLPEFFTILVKKTGESHDIDMSAVPATSVAYLFEYGLRQKINDSHSALTVKGKNPFPGSESELRAAVSNEVSDTIESIYNGTVMTRAPTDPAVARIRAAARAIGFDLGSVDPTQLVALAAKLAKKAAA